MIKNDWLIDHLKLTFILNENLLAKESFISDIFSIDLNNISKEFKENKLIEIFLDEENSILYKIEYDNEKRVFSFLFSEKKIDYKSNILFDVNQIKNIVEKICDYLKNNFSKSNISLSLYLQEDVIEKNIMNEIFKKNKFNFLIDNEVESFELKLGSKEFLNDIEFRILKSFLFFDGGKASDKIGIKKLGKDQIIFFKQNIILESSSSYKVNKLLEYVSNQI